MFFSGCEELRSRKACGLRAQAEHPVRGHRAVKTLELQLPDGLHIDQLARSRVHALADEDLAAGRLGAEPRGAVGAGADGAVVERSLEADGADGGETLGDADAGAQLVAEPAPARGELL